MSDLRKLAAQAMEYLADYTVGESPNASAVNDLIADLDAALALPEQEQEPKLVAAYVVQKPKWIKVIKPMKKQKVSNE